jgi:DNA-binding MarR family transcriptional regulator
MSRRATTERDTADRIHSAAIHVLRHARRDDAASGVGPARLSALSVLVFGGARTLRELADAEQVTAPTMSAIVTGLEQDGLARRRPHREDARALRIEATAKGRQLLERARQRRIDNLGELFAALSAGDLETVRKAAEILEAAVRR